MAIRPYRDYLRPRPCHRVAVGRGGAIGKGIFQRVVFAPNRLALCGKGMGIGDWRLGEFGGGCGCVEWMCGVWGGGRGSWERIQGFWGGRSSQLPRLYKKVVVGRGGAIGKGIFQRVVIAPNRLALCGKGMDIGDWRLGEFGGGCGCVEWVCGVWGGGRGSWERIRGFWGGRSSQLLRPYKKVVVGRGGAIGKGIFQRVAFAPNRLALCGKGMGIGDWRLGEFGGGCGCVEWVCGVWGGGRGSWEQIQGF